MAFMDFLKKTKKQASGNLDVPPPPPLPNAGSSFGDFPPLDSAPPPTLPSAPQGKQMPSDFGAPPYPMPPKMADSDLLDMADKDLFGQNFDAGEKEASQQDIGLSVPPAMPSRDELGLDQQDEGMSEAPAQMEMPPAAAIGSQNMQAQPLSQMPYLEKASEKQEAANTESSLQESADDLEPPPTPMSKIRLRDTFFDREYKEAETDAKRGYGGGPLFVTMNDFRDILEKTDQMKSKLKEAGDTLDRMSNIHLSMNDEFAKWRLEAADLQKRFLLMDKKIFELG